MVGCYQFVNLQLPISLHPRDEMVFSIRRVVTIQNRSKKGKLKRQPEARDQENEMMTRVAPVDRSDLRSFFQKEGLNSCMTEHSGDGVEL
jgi:hypothetical protein